MKTLYCPGSALLSAIYVCLMSTIGLGDVPDEYVVYPALLDGRNSDPNRVLRIDDDIVLNLKPASVLTKDLSLRVLKDGLETEHIIDARIIQSNLYKDSAHGTSIVMREDSSGLEVKGIVNRHYAIRPSQLQDRSSVGPREHILFKLAEPDKGGTVEMEELIHLTARSERELPGGKKDSTPLPAEINPELHVVGDAKHVAGFRDVYKNTTKVAYIEYVCLLLNGVNLIFESMSQPRIHINLVGVTMIEDNNTDIFVMDGSYVRGRETLETKFRDFVAKKTRNTTDMVYLLTGHDVVGMHRGDVSIFANGEAIKGGLCNHPNNTAIGEDGPGSYSGFVTMARELAELLGANITARKTYPNGTACNDSSEFLFNHKTDYRFTDCAEAGMREILRRRGQSCWDLSQNYYEMPDHLPGKDLSMTSFCEHLYMYYSFRLDPCSTTDDLISCLVRCCSEGRRTTVLRQAPDQMRCPNFCPFKMEAECCEPTAELPTVSETQEV
ncbi:uncharacterized protein LOC135385445 isoform X2 [Ornithodoros turicata]|uniref:uncharacterized protein LOC135385445 isoform X2 n=1 Tax=Ornithodoros turicata TaxID=34597 RepID=UPI00313A1AEB